MLALPNVLLGMVIGVPDQLRPPAGLGPRGRALWRRLTTSGESGTHLVFSTAERVTLELACRQADDLATLERHLRDEGLVVTGSRGQERLSGLPAEIRLQRAALAKLIHQLALPESDETAGLAPSSRKAQRAAQARWRQEAARRGREASA